MLELSGSTDTAAGPAERIYAGAPEVVDGASETAAGPAERIDAGPPEVGDGTSNNEACAAEISTLARRTMSTLADRK